MRANLTRRGFMEQCTAVSATTVLSAWTASSPAAGEPPKIDWKRALQDPAYGMLPGQPDLDRILALFPHPVGSRPSIRS